MNIGDIVEITGGHESRKGWEGVVAAINGNIVTFQPADTATLEPAGEPFEINAGLLTVQPSKHDILVGMIRGRANHHAKLPNGKNQRHGNPRQYQTRQMRKPAPG